MSVDDLRQEGFLGVARAKELYNPELASFLTYSQYWIKMSMFSLAYKNAYMIEVPEEFHSIYSKYIRAVKERRATGEPTDLSSMSKFLKVTQSRLSKVVKTIKSLKAQCSMEYAEYYPDTSIDMDKPLLDRSDKMIKMLNEVATPEEVFVIDHMLGLSHPTPKTLSWVGNILGVTKERVRQIKKSGLEKMAAHLREIGWTNGTEE